MKKMNVFKKDNLKEQKKLYLLLIGLALVSFIFGIIFIFFISKDNVSLINKEIEKYFLSSNKDYLGLFLKALFNNFIYILIVWLFGISIFGVLISIIIMMFKSFLFGFSFISIISTYGFKGLLIALFHMFPHQLIFLVILLLVTFYASSFSLKLFKHLFLKRPINFRDAMNKYLKILFFSLVVSLFISLYDGFISNFLVNLFN